MSDADPAPENAIDLQAIERDLLDVELALARLESGAYWTDEVTGEPLPMSLLFEHPTARRAVADPERPPSTE